SLPAVRASSTPFSERPGSRQPVNRLSLFHSLWPCRTSTSTLSPAILYPCYLPSMQLSCCPKDLKFRAHLSSSTVPAAYPVPIGLPEPRRGRTSCGHSRGVSARCARLRPQR